MLRILIFILQGNDVYESDGVLKVESKQLSLSIKVGYFFDADTENDCFAKEHLSHEVGLVLL